MVARNARENFENARSMVGSTVEPHLFERLQLLTERTLNRVGPLVEERAQRGIPRETHGDLHLDHIYYFPDRPAPNDFVIVDCIEFNERFRYADPVADAAFLYMDLKYHGRWDLALEFKRAYCEAAHDSEAVNLFCFYSAYRAIIRAKVEGLKAMESEVPPVQRAEALANARAHWLLALVELEDLPNKPCLVLIGGLPGSGKSTLARELTANGQWQLLQTDRIRKEIAGSVVGHAIYTPAWNQRTYEECRRRAQHLLCQGKPVVVDGNFRLDAQRRLLLECGVQLGVPTFFFHCQADSEVVRSRLQHRKNDISDADWDIYLRLAAEWQPFAPFTQRYAAVIDTSGSLQKALSQVKKLLEMLAL
jgi:predicted kinase